MQISITEKEVNAIDFGLEQIRDALEGSSSEEYRQDAEEAMRSLGDILRKCHLAREKANELNEAKRYIRSRNGYMSPTKLDKMARLLIKKSKEKAGAVQPPRLTAPRSPCYVTFRCTLARLRRLAGAAPLHSARSHIAAIARAGLCIRPGLLRGVYICNIVPRETLRL